MTTTETTSTGRLSPAEHPHTTTTRRFLARSRGFNAGGTWIIGPVQVEVDVVRYEDDAYHASYYVRIDGRHQFGGVADHLDEAGLPSVAFLTDWAELTAAPAPMAPPVTTTLRQAVEALGFDYDGLSEALWSDSETVEVIVRPAVDRCGRIFVHCGGEAIFAFQPARIGQLFGTVTYVGRAIYLVRDDNAGQSWDACRRLDRDPAERGLPNHRPSPRLRLVQSG